MKHLFTLSILFLIFSCTTDSNTYSLEGETQGFEDGTQVLVFKVLDNNQPQTIDTLTVKDGKFSGSYPKTEEIGMRYLTIGNAKTNLLFFPENTDLKAVIDKDNLQDAYVLGGTQNELYTSFTKRMNELNIKKKENIDAYRKAREEQDGIAASEIQKNNILIVNEESDFKKDFVTTNSNSLFSVMLLSEMINRKEINASEANEILGKLSPKMAATSYAKQVKEVLSSMKKADVGAMAPQFSAPTPEGEMVSLKEAMGTYTIIDFWASWCKPCRRENPNLVRVYEKYHDKGLNIISISLDKDSQKDRWIKAIEDDKLSWTNISNLKFWREPIALQYNVRSIPAAFLIDSEGKIIAKNLRGRALDTKMAELFGE